jgi:transcriptional regulator GlxA family with amidase domain
MHRVVALAIPNVVAFDLSIAAQVFGHDDERDHYSFEVASGSCSEIRTTTGFAITATAPLSAVTTADTVVVPGFEPLKEPAAAILETLRAAADRGTRMVSICTGAFALAAAGLLDDRPATTHWRDCQELTRRYPRVRVNSDALYIDDGDILTSAGVAAGIDLCLHVVRVDRGAGHANRVARRMVTAPHRSGGQAQYVEHAQPAASTPQLAATCQWALSRLAGPLTVEHLARHAKCSSRTLRRHFRSELGITPLAWLTEARVRHAQHLLESTDLGIDQVAQLSGLGTATALRTQFAQVVHTTPSAYRANFRAASKT